MGRVHAGNHPSPHHDHTTGQINNEFTGHRNPPRGQPESTPKVTEASHLLLLNGSKQEAALAVGERRFLHSAGTRRGRRPLANATHHFLPGVGNRRHPGADAQARSAVWAGLEGGDRGSREGLCNFLPEVQAGLRVASRRR